MPNSKHCQFEKLQLKTEQRFFVFHKQKPYNIPNHDVTHKLDTMRSFSGFSLV